MFRIIVWYDFCNHGKIDHNSIVYRFSDTINYKFRSFLNVARPMKYFNCNSRWSRSCIKALICYKMPSIEFRIYEYYKDNLQNGGTDFICIIVLYSSIFIDVWTQSLGSSFSAALDSMFKRTGVVWVSGEHQRALPKLSKFCGRHCDYRSNWKAVGIDVDKFE